MKRNCTVRRLPYGDDRSPFRDWRRSDVTQGVLRIDESGLECGRIFIDRVSIRSVSLYEADGSPFFAIAPPKMYRFVTDDAVYDVAAKLDRSWLCTLPELERRRAEFMPNWIRPAIWVFAVGAVLVAVLLK